MTDVDYMARVQAMERKLYRVAHALLWNDADCADAIQEAVVKGWLKRESLRNPEWLETWLTRILINECKRLRARRQPVISVPSVPFEPDDRALHDALQALEEKYRLPIQLHCIEGYDVAEVARMLRLPQGTVKSRMARGRTKLRELLEEEVLGE